MSRRTPALVLIAASALLLAYMPSATATHNTDRHSANMSLVKTLTYQLRNGQTAQRGTDIEFKKLSDGRWYAFAGTYLNGLQIVDVAWPPRAQIVGVYDCGVTQGDVQVFTQAQQPGRAFAAYTSDTVGVLTSPCYREAAALGFRVTKVGQPNTAENGTFIADVTNPRNPFTVSFIPIAKGSHNQTVHPSGNFLYNSNSDLATSTNPGIEIFDISDIANPRFVKNLALPIRPGLGSESHDIAFNALGDRGYVAGISQTHIINTGNPANPSVVTSIFDPTINVSHDAQPFSARNPQGQMRDFLIIGDEFAGAVGTGQCPNGGLHIYDITNETNPVKVGFWVIEDTGPTFSPTDSCTAHVFRIYEPEKKMTIAFYNGGVRVLDLSNVAGVAIGDNNPTGGIREIGFYRTNNANTWAAKAPFIYPRSGDMFIFGNDIRRGLDIYHFDADGQNNFSTGGRWMTPSEAEAFHAQFGLLPASLENPTFDQWMDSQLTFGF
jgi:hypothetical protein